MLAFTFFSNESGSSKLGIFLLKVLKKKKDRLQKEFYVKQHFISIFKIIILHYQIKILPKFLIQKLLPKTFYLTIYFDYDNFPFVKKQLR